MRDDREDTIKLIKLLVFFIFLILLTGIVNSILYHGSSNFISTTEDEMIEFKEIIGKTDGYKITERQQIKENEYLKYVVKYKTKEKIKSNDKHIYKTKDEKLKNQFINLINKSEIYKITNESYNYEKKEYRIEYV